MGRNAKDRNAKDEPRAPAAPRTHRVNLADQAYDQAEELIVTCVLRPGQYLSIQDLQTMIGSGRTPAHQAVSRLASDTLIQVRPRHGLQVPPIDLARERVLLPLRRDMERFVVRLATTRSGPAHRTQMRHIARTLRERRDGMTIGAFNQLDRRIDALLAAASGEKFVETTLRPLHTIFRRVGWIYHSWVRPEEGLDGTIDCHLAILDAVAAGEIRQAVTASDALIGFSGGMLDVIEAEIDPALLDCNLAPLAAD
ncbi:MAG TPA: GntR family transcriptional regulator [Rhodopila sp.]|uniref:GntR family transcriptional regulator n=1 Tax=Rhodopila sp. TaxID=2480087 RepID=UPI002BAA7D30|nr:GntR family transcriptional regulator [Rhodopila sp.]HVY14972.1 GntR family transcriptional regulator [Rhodopila sp.]